MNDALAAKTLVGGSAPAQAEGRAKLGQLRALAPSVAADRLSSNAKAAPRGASFAGELNGARGLDDHAREARDVERGCRPRCAIEKGKRDAWVRTQADEKRPSSSARPRCRSSATPGC